MQKSDFTVHLSPKEMIKMQELHLKFSTYSRNAIIKECINAYVLKEDARDTQLEGLKSHINSLFAKLNPDFKRKRNLPYNDVAIKEGMYKDIPNFASITPNGEDE